MNCDIIIPVWNQYRFTKECIDSVLSSTASPFHLLIVDNGSGEPTKSYLQGLVQEKPAIVTLLRNVENLGFVKAVNQGIRQSQADYVCLLNNDTQVSAGWLKEMLKVAEAKENIGIVNPNSNTLGYKVKKGKPLAKIAQELRSFSGQYAELAWATGFCMLLKRQVLNEVGLFDETFGRGTFEDADFCKRAERLGYLCVCARAAYVYHRERRSFIKVKRFRKHFARNQQIFFSRWGKTERILYILTKAQPSYIQEINRKALEMARQGHIVWFFLKDLDRQKINKHSNIYIFTLPAPFFNWINTWRILKRKKKFAKIYVDDEACAKRLSRFRMLHKAEVIYVR